MEVNYLILILVLILAFLLIRKWLDVQKTIKTSPGFPLRKTIFYLFYGFASILFGLPAIITGLVFDLLSNYGINKPDYYEWYSLAAYALFVYGTIKVISNWENKTKESMVQNIDKNEGLNVGNVNTGGGDFNYYADTSKKKEETAHKFLTNIPKINSGDFIGRDNELEDIREKSKEPGKSILLSGIGGIGKTSLAMAFIGSSDEDFEHLIWLEQSGSFESSITDNPTLLSNLKIDYLTGTPKQKAEYVLNRISNLEGPSLFIIDNADEQVQSYIKLLPSNCSTIICSRIDLDCDEKISVGFLKSGEAVKLFYKHYNRDQNDKVVTEIIELLDYHTLAIELVSKTAQVLRITPLEELLVHLKKEGLKGARSGDITTSHSNDSVVNNTFRYLCTIFDFGNHNEKELLLLKYFSMLPSLFISFSELEEILSLKNKSIEERDEITKGINSLKAKGWLIYNNDLDAYKMHLIIQEVVIEKLKPVLQDVSELVKNMTGLVHYDNSEADHNLIDKLRWYPYGERLGLYFFEENDVSFAFLLNRLGILACDAGKYEVAKKFLTRALEIVKEQFGEDSIEVAKYYSELAILYSKIGHFEKAIEFTERALHIEERHYEEKHEHLIIRCANLTSYYRQIQKFDQARAYGERAIEISLHNFPFNDPRVAVCQSELGLVFKDVGHYEKAKELLERAYESDLKNYGDKDSRVANRKSNLGMVYRDLEEFDKAYNLVKEALDSDLKNFGEENPATVIRRSNLGIILKDMGQLEEAKQNLEIALKYGGKIYSINNPNFAQIQVNLASVLYELKETTRAWGLLTPALETLIEALGPQHAWTKKALILKERLSGS